MRLWIINSVRYLASVRLTILSDALVLPMIFVFVRHNNKERTYMSCMVCFVCRNNCCILVNVCIWGYLKTDERARLQSVIKAKRYGYLPHDSSTLDQLIDQSDEKLFFFPDITRNIVLHKLLPNLKTPAITFVNERTIWYCPQMPMLLSDKILFPGCYFVTFISVAHCHILCVFLLFHCIICMCVCHMF